MLTILEIVFSNLLLATALALVVCGVTRWWRHPASDGETAPSAVGSRRTGTNRRTPVAVAYGIQTPLHVPNVEPSSTTARCHTFERISGSPRLFAAFAAK